MADLSSEIIQDILSRMPVKSVARSRCVSKQWRNYINDSYFESMHAKRAAVNDPMLIVFDRFTSRFPNSPGILTFLEYKYEEENCSLELRKKPPSSTEYRCSNGWNFGYPEDIILGSCNGLLYSSYRNYTYYYKTTVVIHPLKKECYLLPPINYTPFRYSNQPWESNLDQELYPKVVGVEETNGLGFDESTNTFKMVSVVVRKRVGSRDLDDDDQVKKDVCTMVHVLGTDSWRMIPQVPCYPITGGSVFANGRLHWLIGYVDNDDRPAYLGKPVVSFDVVNEEFGLIDPPQERPSGWVREQLVDLNGQLGYVYDIVNHIMEVWVLKEGGWVMHCEFPQEPSLPLGFIKVLGLLNEDGDILMMDEKKHMFVYNSRKRVFEVGFVEWKEEYPVEIRLYQT
ncbi:hypothetical protein QVD17_28115 [Tagetes erecta]|uniref:F-box domain-containing protein n=1 Tax=Tagetes erecta TaxID=13708 RepID=A0AAD8KD77_TARER|nr:hypothetical protein QVD17_28115 [Tagetes erecta]